MLMTKRISGLTLLPLLTLCCCLLAGIALAQEETAIGKVIALRGQAVATDATGTGQQLAIGSEINVADVISTGRRCRLQIMFADSTIVSLGPISEFVVKEYAWDAQTQQGKMNSRVNEGVFRVLGGSITKSSPQNFTTETPGGTIGIRGSMYAGLVRDDQLSVVFQGGTGIYVTNSAGHVELSIPGYGTRVDLPSLPPEEPYLFSPEEIELLDPVITAAPALEGADSEATSMTSELGDDNSIATAEESTDNLPQVLEIPVDIDPPGQAVMVEEQKEQIEESIAGTIIVTPPVSPPAIDTALVSGRFTAVQNDKVLLSNIADITWLGSLTGQTSSVPSDTPPIGTLTATANTNNGSFAISSFTVPVYDPSLPYTGSTKQVNISRTVELLGSPVIFNTAAIETDNAGEFSIFTLNSDFGPSYNYAELGFLGTPTLSQDLPTTGISQYNGPMVGSLESLISTEFETIGETFDLAVNWHSGKVLGGIEAGGKTVGFFIGNVSGTGFTTSLFFGNNIVDSGPGDPILAIDGTSDFAQFYGSQFQGVGFDLSGNSYSVENQAAAEELWQMAGAGFRDVTLTPSSTGSSNWQGFVVGVGEDMAAPLVNRRYFMNSNSGAFAVLLNRDTGTVAGNLSANDLFSSEAITNMTVGGTIPSAYISDQVFAAGLGGSNVINLSDDLKTYGNYLITEDPNGPQLATYASWGVWEIAYVEPGSLGNYHVHTPSSLWVAGEKTPVGNVASLISSSFMANYTGGAEGVQIPTTGSMTELTGGSTNLFLEFDSLASIPVSGTISFNEVTLNVSSNITDLTANGFNASIPASATSFVNGAFYGPNAESIAGNFYADPGGGSSYMGVFGGDR